MMVIYRGRRYLVPDHEVNEVRLALTIDGDPPALVRVELGDRDLILAPSGDDLHLAEAFERGEINAFEYPDGHTYPAHREIAQPATRIRPQRIH